MEQRSRLLAIARRQWLIVLECVLAAGLVAGVYSATRLKEYDAQAIVTIGIDALADLENGGAATDTRDITLDVQQATSTAVQLRVADVLDQPVAAVRASTRAEAGSQRGQILLTSSGPTPAAAAARANAFATSYIAERKETGPLPLQRAIVALEGRLADVQRQIDEASGQLARLPDTPANQSSRSILSNKLASASSLYQTLYGRQQTLLYRVAVSGGDAAVTLEALPPGSPARPRPVRDTAVGILLGIIAGLGAAALRERLNDKVTDREDTQADIGLPVLAEVPVDPKSTTKAGRLAAFDEQHGPLVESIRTLRSSLQFLAVDRPLKRIVVTSGSPNEGKSYVAANLAVAYALAGFETILVSSDLRRPGLDRTFESPPGARGLSSAIAGIIDGPEAAVPAASVDVVGLATPTGVPKLSFVPAGPPPPNAGELLAGQRANEIFNQLARTADVLIFDSPPLLAVSDGAVLASMADGVVIVAAAEQTRRHALRRSKLALEAANASILGLVLNKSRRGVGGYDAYYYTPEEGQEPRGRRGRGRVGPPSESRDGALSGSG